MKSRAPRFLAALPASIHLDEGDYSCEATNLSRKGVLLTVSDLQAYNLGGVRFTLRSAAGDIELKLEATVAHVRTDEEGALEIGASFPEAMAEADRKKLEALVARVVEGTSTAALDSLTSGSTPVEVRAALDKIPVAHRISMAGRATTEQRDYFRHDANPKVLEALARNPHNTLNEIKALVRMREHLPGTLDWVARDQRWKRDEELKVMLATHPRVTLQIATRVVETMDERTRQKALQTPGLPPALRTKLLNKRNIRGS